MTAANTAQVENLVSLLDGYATKGGHHLNVNVLNRDTLLDAQTSIFLMWDRDYPYWYSPAVRR